MMSLLRHAFFVALACAITALLLFRAPAPDFGAKEPPVDASEALRVQLVAEQLAAALQEPVEPEQPVEQPPPPAPVPDVVEEEQPTPELVSEAGSRAGDEEAEADAAPEVSEAEPEPADESRADEPDRPGDVPVAAPTVEELRSDTELVELAHAELSGEADLGFSTVLIASARDQLDIARAFGEEVVLVPRTALDPNLDPGSDGARSFRIEPESLRRGRPRVETIAGRPDLERYLQYRDLLAYDYASLPEPLRQLRKSVVRRDEIFLFAALVPPSEWAVVIGRRRAAVAALSLDERDVEQYVLRYVRLPGDRFDLVVDAVVTGDGRRHTP